MSTARNLLLALCAIALLMAALTFLSYRGTDARSGASTAEPTLVRPTPRPTPPPQPTQREQPDDERFAPSTSARLMPPGFAGLRLGMSAVDLRRTRPNAHLDPRARTDGRALWEESDESGARVLYLLSTATQTVVQVQFASRLESQAGLATHLSALRDRYGTPTGVWDCPETEEAPPLRRFTWRSQGASLMEAILLYQNTVSLTLVIGTNADLGDALTRSRCQPVRTPEQLERFPVASALRGQRTPYTSMAPVAAPPAPPPAPVRN